MPLRYFAPLLAVGLLGVAARAEVLPLDTGWRFQRDEVPGAEKRGFSDAAWETVDVPHDWAIAGPFAQTNATSRSGAFLPSGVSWYRHVLPMMAAHAGQRCVVEFDGIMANSDVWVNGVHLGHRPNGYVGQTYELTGALRGDGHDVLAVRTDTSAQPASRWYEGAGIYRHVRLHFTGPVHLAPASTFVTTPEIAADAVTVSVAATVTNSDSVAHTAALRVTLRNPDGSVVPAALELSALTLAAGAGTNVQLGLHLADAPQLWDLDHPNLYQARVQVVEDGQTQDEEVIPFGVRRAEFSADQGFLLNGRKVVLKGVCVHEDGGAMGVAIPLNIWADRLRSLRVLGVNAIRTAHNPPAPEFLDLCDRMGFLVMDEFFDCWTVAKNRADYHLYFRDWARRDAADAVRRDRNHPSVILYSVGNEIHDTRNPAAAKAILAGLVQVCHENDPTRAVTQALFRPNTTGDYTNGLADLLDVIGTNYRDRELLAAQSARPGRKIVGTEEKHDVATWLNLREHPSLAGQFLWTGLDYLGESPGWPRVGYTSGLVDRTGAIKPMAWERASWWSSVPGVHLARRVAPDDQMPEDPGYGGPELHTQVQFRDWNPGPTETRVQSVEAYSSSDEVELFLNGVSLGAQKIHADASPRVWRVPYAPGVLRAVARDHGLETATDELRTAGAPARLQLAWQAPLTGIGWDDVAIVRATVVDANGVPVPRADNLIHFHITGSGSIVAVDNNNFSSHDPFHAPERRAYHGTCVAYVRAGSTGALTVTAETLGLPAATLAGVTPATP